MCCFLLYVVCSIGSRSIGCTTAVLVLACTAVLVLLYFPAYSYVRIIRTAVVLIVVLRVLIVDTMSSHSKVQSPRACERELVVQSAETMSLPELSRHPIAINLRENRT